MKNDLEIELLTLDEVVNDLKNDGHAITASAAECDGCVYVKVVGRVGNVNVDRRVVVNDKSQGVRITKLAADLQLLAEQGGTAA